MTNIIETFSIVTMQHHTMFWELFPLSGELKV